MGRRDDLPANIMFFIKGERVLHSEEKASVSSNKTEAFIQVYVDKTVQWVAPRQIEHTSPVILRQQSYPTSSMLCAMEFKKLLLADDCRIQLINTFHSFFLLQVKGEEYWNMFLERAIDITTLHVAAFDDASEHKPAKLTIIFEIEVQMIVQEGSVASSIAALETYKFDGQVFGHETICSICLDEFVKGIELTCLPCSHVFHQPCVIKWLKKKKFTCPLCRSAIP